MWLFLFLFLVEGIVSFKNMTGLPGKKLGNNHVNIYYKLGDFNNF